MKTVAALCCLLSVAVWTADANINVEGTEGGEVSFVCQHKLASGNDKTFCQDPCKSSEDILATVQSGAMVQKGRITLEDQGTGAFTVSISRLQLSDAGTYWCAVDRKLFTTYTAVHLTIKKGVVTVATTVTAEVSPTWTQAETFNSTQPISEMDTGGPAHISTTSNTGDDRSSTGTLLYACIGAASLLTVLLCAASFRKCRKVSEPQPQVSSSADQTAPTKTPPKKTCAQQPNLHPRTSAGTAGDRLPSPIYENCCVFRENTDSRQSAANAQSDHDIASRIYIRPLPPIVCEQTHEGSARKTREKTAERDRSEANIKESKPKTLWFGLDLSGTI